MKKLIDTENITEAMYDAADSAEEDGPTAVFKAMVEAAPAVEAVPVGYALANLDGTIRNHGNGELMAYRKPFSRSDKTDCIPLYTHPPELDVCNMEYMGNSVGYIYQKMEAYRYRLGQVKTLDTDTRKMVLDLCKSLWTYESDLPQTILNMIDEIEEKLGAGDE